MAETLIKLVQLKKKIRRYTATPFVSGYICRPYSFPHYSFPT